MFIGSDQSAKALLMKINNSRFDSLVARYYPAVYGMAVRLTEDPREAVALTAQRARPENHRRYQWPVSRRTGALEGSAKTQCDEHIGTFLASLMPGDRSPSPASVGRAPAPEEAACLVEAA